MSANVALSDTFDTWRTRTNILLKYTQTDGGNESLKIANTTDSSSNSTGAITTTGGLAAAKSVYIGENQFVQGNTTLSKKITVNGNTTIGSDGTDVVVLNASLNSDVLPLNDATSASLGSATKRFGALYVNGVVGDTSTGSIQIPSGTTLQRSGETGSIRYNSTLSRFEGNTGTNFESLAVGTQDQDGDTKIVLENSADEDTIRFFTGNTITQPTERVNISTGGNVAIGTGATYGDAMLQVSGTANVSGTVTLGSVTLAKGNVTATGAFVNATTTDYITLAAPVTTIDSPSTILTGNLVVQGTRTYLDTSHIVGKDKTLVLGAGSDVFSDSTYTTANPTTVTSKKNGSTSNHGLTTGDRILVTRSDDASNIPSETLYIVTVVSSTTFTIPLSGTPGSTGDLDFVGPQLDTTVDDAGLVIAGNTVHKFTWDDADDSWNFTDSLDVTGNVVMSGDAKLGNNRILASDGGVAITTDTSDNVTIGNNLQVGGNIIKASDGGTTITMDTSDNVTIGNNLKVGGNIIQASDGGSTITMDTGDNVTIGGDLIVGNNVIRASDSGTTISMDTSDNVTIGNDLIVTGDLRVNGNDIQNSDGEATITMDANRNAAFANAASFVGLVTCNGGLTVEDGDTFTFDGTGFTIANNFVIKNSAGTTDLWSAYMLN